VLAIVIIGVAVAFSRLGTLLISGLPIWFLVGSQVFRLPLELLMHRAYIEGIMPVQMSYSGRNYDIVSGITAGVLGLWLIWRAPRFDCSPWGRKMPREASWATIHGRQTAGGFSARSSNGQRSSAF
jgi:hypothetical protein